MENVDQYFDSYDNLEVHRLMLSDKPRTDAYRKAILQNASYFKNKVVMDIGAGTGILSLFAKSAGASKIYAVEASPMAVHLKKVILKNEAEDVIKVLHQMVEDVELTERVDIIISEWMGFYLVHESMLDSILIARDKHLKEDGIILPSHAQILAAPCSLKTLKETTIDYWHDVYGYNMAPLAVESLKRTKPEVMIILPNQILSLPTEVANIDLKYVTIDELQTLSSRKFVSITRTGAFHGLAIWFNVSFNSYEDEWINSTLNTGPEDDPTHWKQTIIPLFGSTGGEEDVEVDEIIGWEVSLSKVEDGSKKNERQYAIQVEVLDPATSTHPIPCQCQSAKCSLISALMEQEEKALAANLDLETEVE